MSPESIEDIYPLSPLQEGILFHSLVDGERDEYFRQFSCRLRGRIDLEAFVRAWQRTVERHPTLRTAFLWEEIEEPHQIVFRQAELPVEVLDWRSFPAAEQERRLTDLLARDRRRGFDLGAAPMTRLTLVHLAPESHHFIWSFHHLVLDGWSVGLVMKELTAHYASGPAPPSLAPSRPYRDYLAWIQRQDMAQAERFWCQQLAGFDEPTPLAFGRSQPARIGASATASLARQLPAAASGALTRLARRHRLTLSTLVQGVWGALLSRTSGRDDVVFGATVSGRPTDLPGFESMVGMFINTLPARLRLVAREGGIESLRRLHSQLVEMRQYEFTPLVQIHGWSAVPRGTPLFESIVVFQNYRTELSSRPEAGNGGGTGSEFEVVSGNMLDGTNFPVAVIAQPGPRLKLRLIHQIERFESTVILRLLDHFMALLSGLAETPERPFASLPLLGAAAQAQLTQEWNDTSRGWTLGGGVQELVRAQAERSPESLAVMGEDVGWTYLELWSHVVARAHLLRGAGVGRGSLVGIGASRSASLVGWLLAVLEAGGAYLPLDPALPASRLAYMLEDSGAHLVLDDGYFDAAIAPAVPRLRIDEARAGAAPDTAAFKRERCLLEGEDLAYVIYTSGSTGRPKGVAIPHGALINFLESMRRRPGMAPADRLLAITTLSFDIAALELFLPLTVGAQVVVAPSGTGGDPEALRLAVEAGVTQLQATPAGWRMLLASGWEAGAGVKGLCGGEALPLDLAGELLARGIELWNVYGPTETTVWSTCARISGGNGAAPRIDVGRPIGNTEIHLLDQRSYQVPLGVPGELHIGGAGLARGYWRRPGLSSQKFIPHPCSASPGARLYKTGDLARFLADGSVEHLGRLDHQLKVRGFRIETGEIEYVLAGHPGVSNVVVSAREDGGGEMSLVAHVAGETSVRVADLRARAASHLPSYMIPSTFVLLEELPLTPSGKVDLRALPSPGPRRFTEPRDTLELRLVRLWAELLGVSAVGLEDDFFALGGHSLLAVRLVARIERDFGVRLPLAVLLENATVECVALLLRQGGTGSPSVSPRAALIELQPRGSRPPLWLVHPVGGHVFCYLPLAGRLGLEQPLFAFSARGLEGEAPPRESIEAMAEAYLAELRQRWPQGPYLLGGWSMGGTVAFEMALRLEAAGEQVEQLFLIDSRAPDSDADSRAPEESELLAAFARDLGMPPSFAVDSGVGREIELPFAELLGRAKAIRALPEELELDAFVRLFEAFRAHLSAVRRYRPHRTVETSALLVRSTRSVERAAGRQDAGWRALLGSALDVRQIPGDHWSILREPHVGALAELLRTSLEEEER